MLYPGIGIGINRHRFLTEGSVVPSRVTLEDGFFLLLEDGSYLLL